MLAAAAAYPFAPPMPSSSYPELEHNVEDLYDQHQQPHVSDTYHFEYAVHDPHTGDEKSQNEVGDGHGGVKGTYSLVEPDGSTRVVEYMADAKHGFTANVKKIPPKHRVETHDYDKLELPEYGFSSYPAPVQDEVEHYRPELFSSHWFSGLVRQSIRLISD